jgi:hypothetical protein
MHVLMRSQLLSHVFLHGTARVSHLSLRALAPSLRDRPYLAAVGTAQRLRTSEDA